MNQRAISLATLATMVLLASNASFVMAAPTLYGHPAVQYATVTNPFELAFGPDESLYCGHNTNSAVQIYRIPPGGGAAQLWGSVSPIDPDGIDVSGAYVYAGGEKNVWQTDLATGVGASWTTWTDFRNIGTLLVDSAGRYGAAGNIMIGNCRYSYDIEFISAATREPILQIDSADLYVPRALLFAQDTLYCLEASETKGIWAISATGDLSLVDDGGFAWDFNQAMVYDPTDDALLVGDGELIVRVPRTGGAAQTVGTGFGEVAGLSFGPDGWLYVADGANDAIWRVLPEPATLALLAVGGVGVLLRRRRA